MEAQKLKLKRQWLEIQGKQMKERSWQVAIRGTEVWVKENVPLELPFGKRKLVS